MNICVIFGIIRIDFKGKSLKSLILVTFSSPCVYFIAETVGISHTTASESGVFLACIPVASLLASTFILKEKPGKMQVTGILVTLVGVLVTIFAVGASSTLSLVGYIFLLLAVVSYALYSVFVSKATDYTGAEITYAMLVAGTALFTFLAVGEALLKGGLVSLVRLPFKESEFLTAIIYQGIGCSVVAFFLSNIAIEKIGVNRTSSFIGIATVVSILAGALLLNESFTGYQVLGAVVIVTGVYIANINS